MKSNHWGKTFGFTAFGESHSPAIGLVIEDVKPGIDFPLDAIRQALNRRRPGSNEFSSARREEDNIEILSGVFEGKTTGMPICLVVYNKDHNSSDYEILKDLFRPGHADLSYFLKYKIFDYRGGGRASGRETIARVAAAGFVSDFLGDIKITAYPLLIGDIAALEIDESFVSTNPLYWPCPRTYEAVTAYLSRIKEARNSAGGLVELKISNIPAGLGDPVFEKLDANLAKAIISIGSVKGIEFGAGFHLARLTGSEANPSLNALPLAGQKASGNSSAGGILGGISTGEPILLRFVVKPTPSIGIPQQTVNRNGELHTISMPGRFDTCIIPRIIPVAEAMVKLVLADALSYQKLIAGQDWDLTAFREAIDKLDEDLLLALAKRQTIASKAMAYKREKGLPAYLPEREQQLLVSLKEKAAAFDLDPQLIESIWQLIFSCNRGKQL